jgi:hypothetical protein
MSIEQAEHKMAFWKHWLFMFVGACLTLLTLALTNSPPNAGILSSGRWNWHLVWALVQLAGLPLGILFLFSRAWHRLPFRERLNGAGGYLIVEWVLFAAFFVKVQSDKSGNVFEGLAGLLFMAGFVAAGLVLVVAYVWLASAHSGSPEEIFP